MTITVTTDELRAHQAACYKWAQERAAYAFEVVRQLADPGDPLRARTIRRGDDTDKMKEWEAKNPFPKLLPDL